MRVFRISSVKETLANILPYSFLKREQIRAALDYLDGRITGNQLLAIYNQEYELGKRRSRAPAVSAPLTKLEKLGVAAVDLQYDFAMSTLGQDNLTSFGQVEPDLQLSLRVPEPGLLKSDLPDL